jgi:hypothetical protein
MQAAQAFDSTFGFSRCSVNGITILDVYEVHFVRPRLINRPGKASGTRTLRLGSADLALRQFAALVVQLGETAKAVHNQPTPRGWVEISFPNGVDHGSVLQDQADRQKIHIRVEPVHGELLNWAKIRCF